ncbi:MAG TPA: homoserine dehydrogenase [Puia sp.]|nr:homoserine dehydrogenase [Puia sp.]
MEKHKPLTIGLFGFGVVGEGLYKVLQQTPSLKATIKKVCIKNSKKERDAPPKLFTTDRNKLLLDPEINVIVEVINDADAAFSIVTTAMQNKKAVVSASKKMISEHLAELLIMQRATGMSFLYEAAAGASIPIVRNLEEYYDNDLLHSMRAIVNGSTNFILTKMFTEQMDFRQALGLAQQLGFAESNPALDVKGMDAANKWSFLLAHAYGIITKTNKLIFTGVQHIHKEDAVFAQAKNWEIKLVAEAKKLPDGKIAAIVLPQFVRHDEHLAFVKNEYNGVVIESGFADQQFFYGKGAGSFPTASAVLSDISALRYGYRYEYKKLYHHTPHELSADFYLKVYISFPSKEKIPENDFISIEEMHSGEQRSYLIGVLHISKIAESKWWKECDISIIVMPDGIIEKINN